MQNRVRPGVPAGGQFAATIHDDAGVSLEGDYTAEEWRREVAGGGTQLGFDDWVDLQHRIDESNAATDDFLAALDASEPRDDKVEVAQSADSGDEMESGAWAAEGIGADESRLWAEAGVINPAIAAKWNRSGPGGNANFNAPWIKAGFDPETGMDEADAWSGFSFGAGDAGEWKRNGFDPATADVWRSRGIGPIRSARWRAAEFGPTAARRWHGLGYEDPEEAMVLRSGGFDPQLQGSPNLFRAGRAPFKVKPEHKGHQTATYELYAISSAQAADAGCVGCTHLIVAPVTGTVRYGVMRPVTGKRVRSNQVVGHNLAVLAAFSSPNDPDFEPLRGYLGA